MAPMGIADRMLFALEALRMRAEQRDGFVSDDDVMDAATRWTVDQFDGAGSGPSAWPDFDLLVEFLFEQVSEPIDGGGE